MELEYTYWQDGAFFVAFDYTKWHEDLDDSLSVRELSKKAMEYQQKID
ncbi:MAG: hypothetical protein LBU85_02730 [Treponema sp.]|jgi:hypothetical protein|nr:hypothetical protein [Treponema sp.]